MKNIYLILLSMLMLTSCGQKVEESSNKDLTRPNAVKDLATINTGQSVTVDVSANDSDDFDNLDPSTVSIGLSIGGKCIFDTVSPNIKFTPDIGFSGTASCIYKICDEQENCSDSLLEVTVIDTNPPIPQNDFVTTSMGIDSTPQNVALNDSDLEGNVDQFSISISPTPTAVGGSCNLNPAAPFVVFTPDTNFAGTGSCSYEVCDSALTPNCSVGKLEVTVLDTVPPTTVNDLASTTTSSSAITVDVLLNDTDTGVGLDNSSISVDFSVGGTCSINGTNLDFIQSIGFVGVATCGYRVCDFGNNCSSSTLAVTVSDDTAPTVNDDVIFANSGQQSSPLNVSSNDVDNETGLDLSSVTILTSPATIGGTCTANSPSVTFTPASGFSGIGSCSYQICDNASNCSQGNISITVSDSKPPIAINDSITANSDRTPVLVNVGTNDSDPEGNLDLSSVTLSFSVGGSCSVTTSPTVEFIADPGKIGIASCGYFICDTSNNCSNAVIEVSILDGVSPLVANDFSSTISNTPTQNVNVLLNDSDPENNLDLSSLKILTSPAAIGGTCAVNTAPNLVFTPTLNFTGVGSCSYEICDNANNCSTAVLEVVVNDSSFPVAINDTASTNSNSTGVTIDVSSNDTDLENNLDTTSVSLSFSIGGSCSLDTTSPNVKFTPNNGFIGDGSCGYQICDDSSNCSSAVLNVSVLDATAPTITDDISQTFSGQDASPVDVSENDLDPEDNLDISSVSIVANSEVNGTCAISPASPLVVFSPTTGFSGVGSCDYQVCDNANNCGTGTLTVTVIDNVKPIAVNDSSTMDTSLTSVTTNVLLNDSDSENNLDNTSLTVNSSIGGTCSVASPNITFTPNTGFIGNGLCSYEICDTSNNCSNANLDVTVNDGQLPIANNDNATTRSGSNTDPINVLSNDSDPENNLDVLSVTILSSDSNGVCSVTNSPLVVFSPNAGFSGISVCQYQICDKANNCSTADININVLDQTSPILNTDLAIMDTSQTNVSTNVLLNDSDPENNLDNNSLSVTFEVGGTCTVASPNLVFDPNDGFTGQATCGYEVCDTSNNCSTSTIAITVNDGVSPLVNNDISTTSSGSDTAFINVSSNDIDPENRLDTSSVTILASPVSVGGTCSVINSPFVVFSPTSGFSGAGSCTYQICDLDNNCSSGLINITVLDQTPPVAIDDSSSMNSSQVNVVENVLLNDSDPENNLDAASLSLKNQQNGICTVSSPNITFDPDLGFIGLGSCEYEICDNDSNCSLAKLEVSVLDGVSPTANDDIINLTSGTNSSPLDISVNDTDPENNLDINSVVILASPAPVGGSCSVSPASPLIVFTPTAGFSGTGSCTYQICDKANNCDTALITANVLDQTPPVATNDSTSINTSQANASLNVLLNDTDAEGNLDNNSLSVSIEVGGSCSVTTPNVIFTPNTGFTGQGSCGYQVCDTSNNCDTATLTISVTDGNPPIVSDDNSSTDSGSASDFINLASNDIDSENRLDLSSVTILASPVSVGGTCTVTNSPFIVFTPTAGFSGAGSCSYQICDLDNNCSSGLVNVTVNDRTAPILSLDSDTISTPTNTISRDVLVNDSDPENNLDVNSLVIENSENGACSVTTPSITFTPNPGFIGEGVCEYKVCDTSNNCSVENYEITVLDGQNPVLTTDVISLSAGSVSSQINVSDNDLDPENNLDLSSVTIISSATGGSCSIGTASPNVVFTPNAAFSGNSSCIYQICDNANNCSQETISVTVLDTTNPVALDDTNSMNTSLASIITDVLTNDSDTENNLDNNSLSVSIEVGGQCTVTTPNIVFTPNAGFTGQGSCGYQVCDTSNNCDTATLAITVTDGNAPVTSGDSATTQSGADTSFINVASNDIDPEGRLDLGSVIVLASPVAVGGSCTVTNSPFVVFSPAAGFNGAGSCTYQICDLDNNCSTEVISVTVNDLTPPIALDDLETINSSLGTVSTEILGNDSDPENNLDLSSLKIESQSNGSCSIDLTGPNPQITFVANTGFIGEGVCEYEICDTSLNCSKANMEVTVLDNQSPVLLVDSISTTSGNVSSPIDVSVNDSDPENNIDQSSVTIVNSGLGGVCSIGSASPLVIFTPDPAFIGATSCSYQLCDNANNCSTESISVQVNDGTSPIALADTGSMDTSQTNLLVSVLGNDSDPENNLDANSLSVEFEVGGNCSVVVPDLLFTPNVGFTGQASCGYKICDAANNCSTATLAVSVTDGNSPNVSNDQVLTTSGNPTSFVNVSSNDIDPEGRLDISSVTIPVAPAGVGGSCSVANSPFIVYNPVPGFSGAGSCTYQICDLDNNCSLGVLDVTVVDNNSPIAIDDTVTTNQNIASTAFDVSLNDNDPENNLDNTSVTILSSSNGTCSVTSPSVVFTPDTDFAGQGYCEYEICDLDNNCSSANLDVTVNDVTNPTIEINQAASQLDPTNTLPMVYTVQFSEPIDASTFTSSDLDNSSSTTSGGVYSVVNAGDDKEFTIFIYGLSGVGNFVLDIPSNSILDKNGLPNLTASTSVDNVVSYDAAAPTGSEINSWTWNLSSPLDDSFSQDGTPQISLAGSGEDGGSVQVYDDSACVSIKGSPVTISGGSANITDIVYSEDGSEDGEKVFYVRVSDSLGNLSSCSSIGLNYVLDNISPTLSIEQVATQLDPTNIQPIVFDVIFNEEINPSTFTSSDITQTGTVLAINWQILPSADNRNFKISASGIIEDGTVIPVINLDLIEDLAGNLNLVSTSVDNTVEVDTTPPDVNILSAPTITQINDQAWDVSGSCGEPGEVVEVILEPGNIPGNIIPVTQPICQPDNTWATTLDTRSIGSNGVYNVEATHYDQLNQSATTSSPVYREFNCTIFPDIINDILPANITQQSIDLIWSIPNDNGDTIVDYVVEYRDYENTSDWVTYPDGISPLNIASLGSLNPSTNYEFRVKAVNSSDCSGDLSTISEALTKPIHPFFDPFDYELVNVAGATRSRLAALDDGTVVFLYDSPADYNADTPSQTFNMAGGDVQIFNSSKGMILYSEKPIYAVGELGGGTPSWVSPLWSDKILLSNQVRNGSFPATVDIYNIEAGSDITLFEGNTVIATQTNVAADTIITMTIPNDPSATVINLNGIGVLERSFKIESTGFVMATSYMASVRDDMPFLPKSRKVLGVPSRAGFLGTSSTNPVSLTIYHSDGTIQTNKIDNTCTDTAVPLSLQVGSALSIMPFRNESCVTSVNDWRDYSPEVVYVDASDDITGNNVADRAGANAAPFVPISLMKRRYIVPMQSSWIVFASTRPAVINQVDTNGNVVATHTLSRTGNGPNNDGTFDPLVPYKIRLTNIPPGTRFEGITATDLYVGWYEGNNSDPLGNNDGYNRDDETVLYGY